MGTELRQANIKLDRAEVPLPKKGPDLWPGQCLLGEHTTCQLQKAMYQKL